MRGLVVEGESMLEQEMSLPAYEYFSTRDVLAAERVQKWEDHNARSLVALGCRVLSGDPLDATEVNVQFSMLRFAHVTANAHVVERTRAHISASQSEGVAVYFVSAGETFFYHDSGVLLAPPGTVFACNMNRPFLRGFAHGVQELVLTIPQDAFQQFVGGPMPETPIVLSHSGMPSANAPTAELARLVQRSLRKTTDGLTAQTEHQALELVQEVFSNDGGTSASARRRAAISWVRAHLRDRSISVSSVARALGISERHLARAFEPTGTSIGRTIVEMRLSLGHTILSTSGSPTVRDVALYCGFATASHFGRVFRDKYGYTPAEVRDQAAGARARSVRYQTDPTR